jgi:PTS system fructose-specific IIC component
MASVVTVETRMREHLLSVREQLMTGISYMIPFVTIGGLFLAVAYTINDPGEVTANRGTIGWFLARVGRTGLTLMVPILGAYVAYAIADRPGLAPGFVLSVLLQDGVAVAAAGEVVGLDTGGTGAGYLGVLVGGLFAGYVARWVGARRVPDALTPLMPILIVPTVTTAVLAPVLLVGVGAPVAIAHTAITAGVTDLTGAEAVAVGALLGAMVAFDSGGPVNKVAYVFAVGLVPEGVFRPMAAVMIAGIVPPISLALSTVVIPNAYAEELRTGAAKNALLGCAFVTEGAIPYAVADPWRVVPSTVAGSATAAAAAMALAVSIPAPHGGLFVAPLSSDPLAFLGCVALGTLVTTVIVTTLKTNSADEPTGSTT